MAVALRDNADVNDDITECPICIELYTDPKVLPCLHTFCLICLVKYAKDKKPGDTDSCPVCRQEFTIPKNGIEAMPGNLFIEKLVSSRKLSSTDNSRTMCSICTEEELFDESKVVTRHCVECCEDLCSQCSKNHHKLRMSKSHTLVEIGKQNNEQLLKCRPSFCEQHPDKPLELFCNDCKEAICITCHVVRHKSHSYDDINKVSDTFRKTLIGNVAKIRKKLGQWKKDLICLNEKKSKFAQCVAENENRIIDQTDKITEIVSDHKSNLFQHLENIKSRSGKELETTVEETNRQIVMFESFIRYTLEVIDKATASDITRLAEELDSRAKELQDVTIDTVSFPDIKFSPQPDIEVLTKKKVNIVGSFEQPTSSILGL